MAAAALGADARYVNVCDARVTPNVISFVLSLETQAHDDGSVGNSFDMLARVASMRKPHSDANANVTRARHHEIEGWALMAICSSSNGYFCPFDAQIAVPWSFKFWNDRCKYKQ